MKKLITILALFLLSGFESRSTVPEPPVMWLYFVGGQSQAVGTEKTEYSEIIENVMYLADFYSGAWRDAEDTPLFALPSGQIANTTAPVKIGADFLGGPELALANMIEVPEGDIACIIKVAKGGASISNFNGFRTLAEINVRPRPAGAFLNKLDDLIAQAEIVAEDDRYKPKIGGILWMQGLKDSGHAERRTYYNVFLDALIEPIRNRYGASDAPVAITRSFRNPLNAATETIREQQLIWVAGDSNAILIDLDPLPKFDGLHIDYEGCWMVGAEAANFFNAWFD